MAVVIADGVGGAEVGDPSGFEQRDQPGLVLAGDRHRARRWRASSGSPCRWPIENGVDAPQVSAAEGRQAVAEQLVERRAFVDAANFYDFPGLGSIVRRQHYFCMITMK